MHREEQKELTGEVIAAAIEVHRHLGPGLLESAYEAALAHELTLRGLAVERQVPVSVRYKDVMLENGYRLDMRVAGRLILELKSVEQLQPIHEAQLLTYLRHTGHRLGLLINFNVPMLSRGIRRLING